MSELAVDIERDVQAVARIEAVPTLLRVLCETTGMGFAAVARVTEAKWVACAVQDDIHFGLTPGGELDVHTTLCKEVRESRTPVAIDHASLDSRYCSHHTPRHYSIESYISVPIVLANGEYFGNLCAIDPRPAKVSEPRTLAMFTLFAQLVALELDSQRKRQQIEKALLDEKEVGELREQFIAVLGHDLRNPLSAVASYGQILGSQANDPETVRNLAGKINSNVKRMAGLISDVMDFARGRLGGGIDLSAESVDDLDEALSHVVTELRDVHPTRSIEANIDIGRPLRVDRGRIQQLVSNLLGNALTHGADNGAVKLTAGIAGDELVIEVWNQGQPIAEDNLAKIFSPFWRRTTARHREGLGLGLHICDQIVKAHAGHLLVTSTLADGTSFKARLPVMAT